MNIIVFISTLEALRVVRELVVVVHGCSLMAYHLSEADLIEMRPDRAIQGISAYWWGQYLAPRTLAE